MKRYSVLIPAYNSEKYIDECVESVIKQAGMGNEELLDAVEIIIANDGSTDLTGKTCDELALKYRNIKVFHKRNEGLLLTRRFLIEKASAEYVLFLDADDKWNETMLMTLNGYIEEYDHPDIVSFGFNMWQCETYFLYEKMNTFLFCDAASKEKAWEMLLCGDIYNSVWSKAIKRNILLEATVEKSMKIIRRGEDKLLSIACLEIAKSVLFVPNPLYNYRIDNSSMTRIFNPDYFSEILTVDTVALEKIKQYLSGKEEYCVVWSNNLINKYYDYIVAATKSGLSRKDIKARLMRYKKHSTMCFALKHCQGGRNGLKALLIKLELFDILIWYYRR